jgi:hypothetical protein
MELELANRLLSVAVENASRSAAVELIVRQRYRTFSISLEHSLRRRTPTPPPRLPN